MQVKVCNFRSKEFNKDFIDSVSTTGFAVITHHGIPFESIQVIQQQWREFFLSEQKHKNFFVNPQNENMGYKGMGAEKAVGANVADLKEFFHWKPGQQMPASCWAMTQRLFYELEDIGMQILKVLDDHTPNVDYRKSCHQSDNTILRTLYYPAMDFSNTDAVRAAAHEDINFITLLVAASSPGLQVMDKDGEWHDVPHEENSIVVNIGDMLEVASKGMYKSTTHRVVNPDKNGQDRISMPMFIHPHSDVLLADGLTAGQFLDQRIAEIYGKK